MPHQPDCSQYKEPPPGHRKFVPKVHTTSSGVDTSAGRGQQVHIAHPPRRKNNQPIVPDEGDTEIFIDNLLEFAEDNLFRMKSAHESLGKALSTLQQLRHKSLVIIKPPAYARGLTDIIFAELKAKDFEVRCKKILTPTRELAEAHYAEHRDKPFFEKIVSQLCSGEVCVAIVISEGRDNVARLRKLVGATDPHQAEASTIRARYGTSLDDNVIHASDSDASGDREARLWLTENHN